MKSFISVIVISIVLGISLPARAEYRFSDFKESERILFVDLLCRHSRAAIRGETIFGGKRFGPIEYVELATMWDIIGYLSLTYPSYNKLPKERKIRIAALLMREAATITNRSGC